ncbi:MAG TPA: endonuclease/exonuclease/phosphatase family protein [Pyrinomonadaceae bacterium]|nr:endonuclease/exonuclease/phosphatase family protein [Pyrinomonadaceae bacterium]
MSTTAEPLRDDSPAPTEAGLERGDFAPPGAPLPPASLVVATYNIRYAVGHRLISGGLMRRAGLSFPGRRPTLVARNIAKAALAFTDGRRMPRADLIALQEADRGTVRGGRQHVARELSRRLGMSYVRAFAPTPADEEPKARQWYLDFEERIRKGEEGDTGVALLSRLPLSGVQRVELPWAECAWRPRLAVAAGVAFAGRSLQVLNAHVDPHAGVEEQLAQLRALLTHVGDEGAMTVLLGDFNTLSRRSCVAARAMLESLGYETPLPTGTGTWRAGPLRLHADWIFVRALRVRRWGVARGLRVSDHWPVWAEIEPTSE